MVAWLIPGAAIGGLSGCVPGFTLLGGVLSAGGVLVAALGGLDPLVGVASKGLSLFAGAGGPAALFVPVMLLFQLEYFLVNFEGDLLELV